MNKAKVISRGGIYTSLSIILIYIASILPTSKLFLLGTCTCLIMISIVTLGPRNTTLVYVSTSILCLLFSVSKAIAICYIMLFGIYGIIKYYIEKLNKISLELALKFTFFNISIFIIFSLYNLIVGGLPQLKYSIYLISLVLQFMFLIYDYILTLFINYIEKFSI